MKAISLIKLSGILLLASFFVTGTISTATAADQPVMVKSSNSFDNTVSKIKNAIKEKKMAIVFEANHQNMMKMVGVEIKKSIAIGFAKPQMGAKILKAEPRASIEMPMRLAVRELDNGEVWVIYYQPSYLFSHYNNPKLGKIGQKMDKMVGMFVKAGTK